LAGIHGKNAELRISTTESVLSGIQLGDGAGGDGPVVGQIFQAVAANRDWKFDRKRTLIQFTEATGQGSPDDVTLSLNTQTRLINYAGGAVELGPNPGVKSGVFAQVVSMEMSTVGNLIGDARNFTLTVNNNTVDTTTIGESWATFEDGLTSFEGTLDGLYIDDFWYRQAIATLSGIVPRRVLKMVLDPALGNTFYQGTVIFPQCEITGGFDAAIEHSVPLQGRGPLDLVQETIPFFNHAEVF